jgi:ubiquinone/menaquinone biosynthesis C-methylase UbiE
MPSITDFDEKAKTWDSDPVKIARAFAMAEGIRNHLPSSSQLVGLEYGCGTGLLSFALLPHFKEITLADSSAGMLAVLVEKIAATGVTKMKPVMLNLESDPLPAEKYDVIYTAMTLHHVADADKLLYDFYAMLDSPGHLCIVDLDSEDGSFHGSDFTGHKGFDRDELRGKAQEAGFRNIHFTTIFQISKGEGPGQTDFPLFLMVAEKI